MKKKAFSNGELSALCMELALLLHAGIGVADGLHLMAEEDESGLKEVFTAMAETAETGAPLSDAMDAAGMFPPYAMGMIRAGERSGRQEEALRGLSDYYDGRERLDQQIRNALLYPSILLLLMLVVLVVLLAKVLPVFDQVFSQLGGGLTGLAGGLLKLGGALDSAMPVLCVLLGVIAVAVAAFAGSDTLRTRAVDWWNSRRGDRGIGRRLNTARFASGLSMGLRSGLPMEEAMELASEFYTGGEAAAQRLEQCRTMLSEGCGLAEALQKSDILPPAFCRMLALGVRGGAGDTVMAEIARRLENETEQAVETKVSRVEPTLVIVTSLMVGAVLLSVMLPLMNIMASL